MIHTRKLLAQLIRHLDAKEFTIIVGPRQSGKTTLLNQLSEYLQGRNEQVYSFTLEDPSILSTLNSHPENIFNLIIRKDQQRIFILLDEIQYLADPSNFLKLLYDKHSSLIKIIATGSSAFYIDRKFKDSLAGRKRLFDLYTLSFDEMLDFRTGNPELSIELQSMRENDLYRPARLQEIEAFFNEYLTYGGYPAVVLAQDHQEKIMILKELLYSFVKRDIAESKIGDPEKFYRMMLLLAHQTGSLINSNELARTLKLSATSVENYLYVLRKCFHIQLVKPFFSNIRKELVKMPKCYFHDLGLRNILMNQFNPVYQRIDKGELIENYAFTRLREKTGMDSLFFWRTTEGHEVDFVCRQGVDQGEAIEIKYNPGSFNSRKYELFTSGYPQIPLSCRGFEADLNRGKIMAL